jgi:uncharacterized membrane protein YsdA (DUF1294 family)
MQYLVQAWLTPSNIATYAVAVNFLAFAGFGIDKMLAEAGRSRIAEEKLLSLAFIGGTAGAYAGRQLFRHKTRKQPFSNRLHTIAVLQCAGLALFGGWWVWG